MTEPPSVVSPARRGRFRRRWIVPCGILVVAVLASGGYEGVKHWPFRYSNVQPLLNKVFASQVTIDHYQQTYFPRPGFVAQGITLRRNTATDLPPAGSAEKLLVQGSWADLLLLRKRIELVDVNGLHIVIAPVGSRGNHADFPPGSSSDFAGPTTAVEQLHVVGATLDLLRDDGGRYRFPIHDLQIRDLQSGHRMTYVVDMESAQPYGQIRASGSFGPLTPKNLGATGVSGRFTFREVKLREIGSLRGTLQGEGQFSGTLAAIAARATSVTPDFAIGSGQPARVDGTLQCTINGLNADVALNHVQLKTGETTVDAEGTVRGSPKVTEIDLAVTKGREEDLLGPFLTHRPPVVGVVWVKSHAHLDPPAAGAKFLQRLHMEGVFRAPAELLTNPKTEKALTAFSERAQGGRETTDDAGPDVLSALDGSVRVRNGVLLTRRLRFEVPGAAADLGGTYDLRSGAAHLVGKLTMAADLSHATTGWKSTLLKPFAGFFRKKRAGAVVPIAVTGSPGKYKVEQNILHDK